MRQSKNKIQDQLVKIENQRQRMHHAIVTDNNTLLYETQLLLQHYQSELVELVRELDLGANQVKVPHALDTDLILIFTDAFPNGALVTQEVYSFLYRTATAMDRELMRTCAVPVAESEANAVRANLYEPCPYNSYKAG